MKEYQRKSQKVKAIQFLATNREAAVLALLEDNMTFTFFSYPNTLKFNDQELTLGSWLVADAEGRLIVMTDDKFREAYEESSSRTAQPAERYHRPPDNEVPF